MICIFSFIFSFCSTSLCMAFQRSYVADFVGCIACLSLHIMMVFMLLRMLKSMQAVLPWHIIRFMLRITVLFDLVFTLICLMQGNQSNIGDFLSDTIVSIFLIAEMDAEEK